MKTSTFLSTYGPLYLDDPNADIASMLKREGFDSGEPDHYGFAMKKLDPVEASKKLRERFDEEGLECSCYSRGMNMLDIPREEAVARLKSSVDVCEILRAPVLHHTIQLSFHSPMISLWQKHVDYFADICREVAYYAGEKGISCIYEDQGYYVNTPERLSELLSKVDMPNTGICFDTGNALFNDIDPIEYVSMLAPYIKHVHIKDYIRKPMDKIPPKNGWYRTAKNNMLRETILGHGIIDFEKIFEILILAGYNGYYSLEGAGMEGGDLIKRINNSVENMKWFYKKAETSLIEREYIKK